MPPGGPDVTGPSDLAGKRVLTRGAGSDSLQANFAG